MIEIAERTRMGAAAVGLLLAAFFLIGGCRSKICAQMLVCCRKVENEQGFGDACGARASDVDDPETCRTILETVEYMYEEREADAPKACRLDGEGSGS